MHDPRSTPVPDLHDRMLADVNAAIDTLTLGAGRSQRGERPRATPRFRTILACTDASREAERGLEWAAHFAKEHNARVIVASVFDPPHIDASMAAGYGFYPGYAAVHDELKEALDKAADQGAHMLRDAGIDAETVHSSGSPARQLAEIAETNGADLVVLGSRHRTPLGSTADALLDRVHASVLVARTSPPARRILAATDGSHASYRAVGYALREAADVQADLTVQHVIEYPDHAGDVPNAGYLRDVIGRMQLVRPPHVSYHLDAGRPAHAIVAKARELDASLIVLGSRGLGRVTGWLTGSVSRRVAASASTSVLVIKDPPRE